MKIEYHYLPAPVTIEEFAEKHDLTMEVRQRSYEHFEAWFKNSEIRVGCMLRSNYGIGANPEKTIKDYASKISGQTLVIDAMSPKRRAIQVPHLTVE